MNNKKERSIVVKSVKIRFRGKEMEFSLEDARELQEVLNELFGSYSQYPMWMTTSNGYNQMKTPPIDISDPPWKISELTGGTSPQGMTISSTGVVNLQEGNCT